MASEPEGTSLIDTILDLKNRDPFVPFSIVMASGDRYVIESGETLVELRQDFFYASPRSKKFVFLRKSQITAVEQPEERRPARRKAS
jgi:hypothetical protein